MVINMITRKRTIVDHLIELIKTLSLKSRGLKTASEVFFTSIVFMTDACPSGRSIHEDYTLDAQKKEKFHAFKF